MQSQEVLILRHIIHTIKSINKNDTTNLVKTRINNNNTNKKIIALWEGTWKDIRLTNYQTILPHTLRLSTFYSLCTYTNVTHHWRRDGWGCTDMTLTLRLLPPLTFHSTFMFTATVKNINIKQLKCIINGSKWMALTFFHIALKWTFAIFILENVLFSII